MKDQKLGMRMFTLNPMPEKRGDGKTDLWRMNHLMLAGAKKGTSHSYDISKLEKYGMYVYMDIKKQYHVYFLDKLISIEPCPPTPRDLAEYAIWAVVGQDECDKRVRASRRIIVNFDEVSYIENDISPA